MARTNSYIGGVPIVGSAEWSLREGVSPVIQEFEIDRIGAENLLKLQSVSKETYELEINNSDDQSTTIKNLRILSLAPSQNPYTVKIRVADRRWTWRRIHVTRRYNMRRRVAHDRISNPGAVELQRVSSDFWYWKWSLQSDGTEWTINKILKDLGEICRAYELAHISEEVGRFDYRGYPSELDRMPPQNLELEDDFGNAMARVLSYAPDLKLYVDANGTVKIVSRSDGSDEGMVSYLQREVVGEGHIELVDEIGQIPTYVDVLFTREHELRFDYYEPTSIDSEYEIDPERRLLQNVLPVPDWELKLAAGAHEGETVCQGTWITFYEALNSWKNDLPSGVELDLDYAFLRAATVPFMDLWASLGQLGGEYSGADWPSRIAAMQTHFRRTFRIPPRWMDRILSMGPYRISTVNPETGDRSPAVIYSDCLRIPGRRGQYKTLSDGENLEYGINIFGYPSAVAIDDTARVAPAEVHIADKDQGIIHFNWGMSDPLRLYEQSIPGTLYRNSAPTATMRRIMSGDQRSAQPLTFDSVVSEISSDYAGVPRMDSGYNAAVILTAIPAAPNNKNQLYRVRVTAAKILDMLPRVARLSVGRKLNGPPVEIRIGMGVETARFAWLDSLSDDIDTAFGAAEGVTTAIDKLCLNLGDQSTIGTQAASLTAIALASAAREYAKYVTHYVGEAAGGFMPGMVPLGWAQEVEYSLRSDGSILTRLRFPKEVDELNIFQFMDPSTRAMILREPRK